jgi:hypothetical protein
MTPPRRNRFGMPWYARTWLIPAGLLAAVLFAVWPLLAFRRHWTTLQPVPCYPDAWVRYGATCTGTYAAPVVHSGVSALGAGMTAGWLGVLAAGGVLMLVTAAARKG